MRPDSTGLLLRGAAACPLYKITPWPHNPLDNPTQNLFQILSHTLAQTFNSCKSAALILMDFPATPSSYPRLARLVSGQPGGHAGVVHDAVVSDWRHDVSPMHEDPHATFFLSFYQPMLPVVIGQTSTGTCPHLLKVRLPKVNDKNSITLAWTITIWPIDFHCTTIVIMLSTTIPRLP